MISITSRCGERTPPRARRPIPVCLALLALLLGLLLALPGAAQARALPDEDGYALWLRYLPVQQVAPLRAVSAAVAAPAATPTQVVARDELRRGLEGLSGRRPAAVDGVPRDGVVVLGTPASSPLVAALDLDLAGIGEEGYLVRSVRIGGRAATVIAANSDIGVLYGVFHFLRLAQTGQ